MPSVSATYHDFNTGCIKTGCFRQAANATGIFEATCARSAYEHGTRCGATPDGRAEEEDEGSGRCRG